MAATIEKRKLTQETIDYFNRLSPVRLEEKHRQGDFLYFAGMAFTMVHYSEETTSDGQQSRFVSYWSELYDLELNLDFTEKTVESIKPCSDWRALGF